MDESNRTGNSKQVKGFLWKSFLAPGKLDRLVYPENKLMILFPGTGQNEEVGVKEEEQGGDDPGRQLGAGH